MSDSPASQAGATAQLSDGAVQAIIGGRPVTLFTGQWADLPLEVLCRKAKEWGYEGLELACWGDHFEVDKALSDDGYCTRKLALLEQHGLKCYAISNHLVGQGVCDEIDARHKEILSPALYGDGKTDGVNQRCAEEMKNTARAAQKLGVKVVNGFTGSSIWKTVYDFPPTPRSMIKAGYQHFADSWNPILDVFQDFKVRFALEVHPTEIAFDIHSTRQALAAINHRPEFGFNFDPSHLAYQGVDYIKFLLEFSDRIYHVHMKDVAWGLGDEAGVFGGHCPFHNAARFWDFKSIGRGMINFNQIIFILNQIGYRGPLSVEWEQGDMDREFGAKESCAQVRALDYPLSTQAFDAAFARSAQSATTAE